ncbi:MAG: HNH endonuclease signature motif containing protein [Candidatus Dormibacteria bacterium]
MCSGTVGLDSSERVALVRQLAAAQDQQAAALDLQASVFARLDEIGGLEADAVAVRGFVVRNRQLTMRSEYLGGRGLRLLGVSGAGGTVRWLKDELKLSGGEAVERLEVARSLDLIPHTAQLLSTGEISHEQAAIIARSVNQVPAEDAASVEEQLLALTCLNAGAMRDEARTVVARVDGGADLGRNSERAWKRRSLHIGPDINGTSSVSGYLTSEAAVHWQAALEPWMRPAGKDDRRTADQRRHDAALQLVKGARADGAGNGRRPQVVITAPLSALLGEGGPPALLQGRIPIPSWELDRYLCEGDLTVALQNAAGNIVYQGKKSRSFTRAQRRGLVATQQGCAWPGCDLPVEQCDGHHLDEFGQGGKTTSDRGALTCDFHHNRIHSEGWALVPDPGGGLRAVGPGDPDNPRTGLTPEEYIRRRTWAITKRAVKPPGDVP